MGFDQEVTVLFALSRQQKSQYKKSGNFENISFHCLYLLLKNLSVWKEGKEKCMEVGEGRERRPEREGQAGKDAGDGRMLLSESSGCGRGKTKGREPMSFDKNSSKGHPRLQYLALPTVYHPLPSALPQDNGPGLAELSRALLQDTGLDFGQRDVVLFTFAF